MNDEEKMPSIGDRRHGRVLVCMGDDRPDQWAPWLESLVIDFEQLETTADERALELQSGSARRKLRGWRDFCEALGVEIGSQFWEGSMTSGQFVMGWIKAGGVRDAKKAGNAILKQIRQALLSQLRAASIKELQRVTDLDALIERTRDDRPALLAQTRHLTAALAESQATRSVLEEALAELRKNDSAALNLDCVRLAGAVLNKDRVRLLAGPLVLWNDGVVYAFTSRGRVPLPDDSAPSILLKHLRRSGHPTVEVGERTEIARGLSGPYLRTGTAHISGWVDVWREVEKGRERTFVVTNPSSMPTVRAIHDYFKAQPGSPA
jgi:hypothetical protein